MTETRGRYAWMNNDPGLFDDDYPFSWENLGVDGDLPRHFPISQDEHGRGPTNPEPAHHWTCWCGDPECPLSLALQWSWSAGRRKGHEDANAAMEAMSNSDDWESQAPSMGFRATFDQELTERPGYLRRHPEHG